LTACQSTQHVGRVVLPNITDTSDPELNPNPQHIVRLYGTAPASLDFSFRVSYFSTNREGDCWNHAPFFDGGGEKRWAYDLHPVRTGDTWMADLVVDRYQAGRCGWQGGAHLVYYVKPGDASEEETLIGGVGVFIQDYRNKDPNAPVCPPASKRCDEIRSRTLGNSDSSIPVEIRCRRRTPDEWKGMGAIEFMCSPDPVSPVEKVYHHLKNSTKKIEINFHYRP